MLTIKNVRTLLGKVEDWTVESAEDEIIDAEGLTMLPGLIDPHVHFRTPGHEYKEDWKTASQAALAGGITVVFDMPNTKPPCVDLESFEKKQAIIDDQLRSVGIPLRYHLYAGADKNHLENLGQLKKKVIGIKIYMGSSTGGLVMNDPSDLERVFQIAAQNNMLIAVHAEDEEILQERQKAFAQEKDPSVHSKIRDRKAAIRATEQAIGLAEKYNTQLYVCHVSTKEEMALIRDAKRSQLLVYAEVTPHHLFLNEEDYATWGTKIQVNPPIRTKSDQEALWEGIHDRTVDTIGSDHAPHTLEEKNRPYGKSPSGVPGIELTLPLLLNEVNKGRLTLDQIVNLMRINPENLFRLPKNRDIILVNMEKEKEVRDELLKTKCGWSPYTGRVLKGWPVYTILKGKAYRVNTCPFMI